MHKPDEHLTFSYDPFALEHLLQTLRVVLVVLRHDATLSTFGSIMRALASRSAVEGVAHMSQLHLSVSVYNRIAHRTRVPLSAFVELHATCRTAASATSRHSNLLPAR